MRTQDEEIDALRASIVKRDKTISKKDKEITNHKKQIANLKESLRVSQAEIEPVRQSLNSMTAERGRWLRKLKRAGVQE